MTNTARPGSEGVFVPRTAQRIESTITAIGLST